MPIRRTLIRRLVAMSAVALVAWTAPALIAPSNANAIVNGDVVNDSSYPYVGYVSQPTQTCTATLIGPEWALTAGHCLNNFDTGKRMAPADVNITFNLTRLDDRWQPIGGESRQAAEFRYANESLALVRLASPVTDIKPVQVATPTEQKYQVKTGFDLSVVGWGNIRYNAHEPDQSISTHELRDGRTHIYDSSVTRANLLAARLIKTGISEDAESFASFGDSGGPLLSYKNGPLQVGVAANILNLPVYGLHGAYYVPTGDPEVWNWIQGNCRCID